MPEETAAPQPRSTAWQTALTVLQEAAPPSIPEARIVLWPLGLPLVLGSSTSFVHRRAYSVGAPAVVGHESVPRWQVEMGSRRSWRLVLKSV
jgi:hypothetical protein